MPPLRTLCLQIRDSLCEAFGCEARGRRDVVTEDTSDDEDGGEANGTAAATHVHSHSSSHGGKDQYVEVHLLRKEVNERHNFPTNAIRTAKYTTYSALPLSLLFQFRKVSNCYFLLVMALALVPGASPVNPYSSIVPFCIVLGAGVLKDIWEDLKRQDADRRANAMAVQVLRDGQFAAVRSKEIYPGDLLLFRLGDEVKADCVVLNTSLPDGLTYIETSNLDGETNAKARRAKMYTIEHLGTVEDIVDCALHNVLPAASTAAAVAVAEEGEGVSGDEGHGISEAHGPYISRDANGGDGGEQQEGEVKNAAQSHATAAAVSAPQVVYEVNDKLSVMPRPPPQLRADPSNEQSFYRGGAGGGEVMSANPNALLLSEQPQQQQQQQQQLASLTREEREAMRLAASGSYSQGLMLSPVFSYTRGEPHTRTMTITNATMSTAYHNNMNMNNSHLRSASMSVMPSIHRRHLTFDEMLESRGELGVPWEIQDLSRRYELAHPRTHTSTTVPRAEHPRSISAAASTPALVTSPLRLGSRGGAENGASARHVLGGASNAFQPSSPHRYNNQNNNSMMITNSGAGRAPMSTSTSMAVQTGLVMPFAARPRPTLTSERSVFRESIEMSHSPFKNTPFVRLQANSAQEQNYESRTNGGAVTMELSAEESVNYANAAKEVNKAGGGGGGEDGAAMAAAPAIPAEAAVDSSQASPPSLTTLPTITNTATAAAANVMENEGVVVLGSAPGPDLSAWFGQLRMADGTTVALGIDQFLPRGSIIRNTDWVLAAAMYTGPNTKMLLNLRPPLYKTTVMTRRLNQLNVFLFFINQILMFVLCGLAVWWSKKAMRRLPGVRSGYTAWYIQYDLVHHRGFRLFWWRYLSNFVLLSYLIPLSLYVTLEFNKAMQMLMIAADRRMAVYDEFSDTLKKARPKTSELNCQLGQVEYIFTDKTGTLTENLMTYVGGQVGHVTHDERTKPGGVGQLFLNVLHTLQYSEAAMVLKRRLNLAQESPTTTTTTAALAVSNNNNNNNNNNDDLHLHNGGNAYGTSPAPIVTTANANPAQTSVPALHSTNATATGAQSPQPLPNSAITSRSMPTMTGASTASGELAPSASQRQPLIEILGTSVTNVESPEALTHAAAASLLGTNARDGPAVTPASSPNGSPSHPLLLGNVPPHPSQQARTQEVTGDGLNVLHKTIEEPPCCPSMLAVREEAFENEPAFQYLRALALCHTVVCFDLPVNPAVGHGASGHHHRSSSKRARRPRQKSKSQHQKEDNRAGNDARQENEREGGQQQQQQDSVTRLSRVNSETPTLRPRSRSSRYDGGRRTAGPGSNSNNNVNNRALHTQHAGNKPAATSDMGSYYYYLAERRKLREWRQQQLRHLKASHSILLSNPIRVPTAVAAGPHDEDGTELLRQNSSSARQSHEPDDEAGLFPFLAADQAQRANQPLFPLSSTEVQVSSGGGQRLVPHPSHSHHHHHHACPPPPVHPHRAVPSGTPREGTVPRMNITTTMATTNNNSNNNNNNNHLLSTGANVDAIAAAAAAAASHIRFASETAIPTPQHGPTGSSSWYLHRYTTHVAHRRSLTLQMSGEPMPKMEQWIDRSKIYEGQSLDEIALVNAARDNGFCLVHRSAKQMFLRVLGKPMCYDIIAELEFTPQRKLMSILLRRNPADDVLTAEMQTGLGGIGGPRHYHRLDAAAAASPSGLQESNNSNTNDTVVVPVVEDEEEAQAGGETGGGADAKRALWPAAQLPLQHNTNTHAAGHEACSPAGLYLGETDANDAEHQSPLTDTNIHGIGGGGLTRLGTVVTNTTTTTTTTTTSTTAAATSSSTSGAKSHSVSEEVASPHDAHAATRQNTQLPSSPLSFMQPAHGTSPQSHMLPRTLNFPTSSHNGSTTTSNAHPAGAQPEGAATANDKPYLLLVKGADSSMLEILDLSNPRNVELKRALIPQLDETASCGYRTLVLGQRYVSEAEVRQWLPILNDAQCSMQHRSERLHEAYALMERDVDCIGTTAVEDKLQDGVPETLEFFLRASIVVWMLTGDKRETAVTIAHTAGLVSSAFPDTVCHLDITHIHPDNNNSTNNNTYTNSTAANASSARNDPSRQDPAGTTSPFAATLTAVNTANNGNVITRTSHAVPQQEEEEEEEEMRPGTANNNNNNNGYASSATFPNSSPLHRGETSVMSFVTLRTDSQPATTTTLPGTANQVAWSALENSLASANTTAGDNNNNNNVHAPPGTERKRRKSVSFAKPLHHHPHQSKHIDAHAAMAAAQEMNVDEQHTWAVLEGQLRAAEEMCARGLQRYGEKTIVLVVDGKTLDFIFQRDDRAHRFFLLASQCRSAVCCRMTPLQKAQIVRMFQRNMHAVALAVGDGANDVSMLQESKIGVGIMGLEGSQAELASDYAIPKFRFLKRLLFVHGRFSIYREAHCILYSLYKNVILTTGMAAYAFYTGYSGQMFIDSWLLSLFSLLFCALQPIMIGILDKDVEDELAETLPQLYPPLAKESMYFSLGYIMKWLLDGFVEGLAFFFVLIYTIGVNDDLFGTRTGGIDDYGQVFFTMLVLIADLRAGITVTYYMVLFALALVIELGAVPAFEFAYGAVHNVLGSNQSVFIANNLWASSKFWLLLFFAVGVFVVYTVASNLYIQLFSPWKNSGLAMQAMRRSHYYQEHQLAKLNMAQEVAKRLAIQKNREEARRRQHEDRRRSRVPANVQDVNSVL